MRILSFYFMTRVAGLFATLLVAALLLLAAVELVLNFEDLTFISASLSASSADSSLESPSHSTASSASDLRGASDVSSRSSTDAALGALDTARALWSRLASYYLPDLLPIAAFFAVFIALAWAGRSMELTAIQAGGIRLSRVILPILGFGVILSLACGILHETVVLDAQQFWNQRSVSEASQIDFDRSTFWYHRGTSITHVGGTDPETRSLFDVEIFERSPDGRVQRVYAAPHVRIGKDGVWTLDSAESWTFDLDEATRSPRYEKISQRTLDLARTGGASLLGAESGRMRLPALARFLASSPDLSTADTRRLKTDLHHRLSQPVIVFLFVLLAVPFGLAVNRRGRFGMPALGAVLAIGGFYFLRAAGGTLAELELFPAGLSPWLAIGLFGALALVGLRRRNESG